jgi:hypothetical protein
MLIFTKKKEEKKKKKREKRRKEGTKEGPLGTLYPLVEGVTLSVMAVLLFKGATADSWCSGKMYLLVRGVMLFVMTCGTGWTGAETRASLCGGKLRLTDAGCDWKALMLNSDGGSGVVSCLSAVESCCALIWEIYCIFILCRQNKRQ